MNKSKNVIHLLDFQFVWMFGAHLTNKYSSVLHRDL